MPFDVPKPSLNDIGDELRRLFDSAGGVEKLAMQKGSSRVSRDRKTEEITYSDDFWLANYTPRIVKLLSQALRGDMGIQGELDLMGAMIAMSFPHPDIVNKPVFLSKLKVAREKLDRREACGYLGQYLGPLFDATDYKRWIVEMAESRLSVRRREAIHNQFVLDEAIGLPPPRIDPPPNLSAAEQSPKARREWRRQQEAARKSQERYTQYEGDRARLTSFVMSEADADAAVQFRPIQRLARERPNPAVDYNDTLRPANLYISEVGPVVSDYLSAYQTIWSAASRDPIVANALTGATHAILTLAVLPVHGLYNFYQGTCVVERLLPRLRLSSWAAREYVRGPMMDQFAARWRRLPADQSARLKRTVEAFRVWAEFIVTVTIGSHDQLVRHACQVGLERVLTPPSFSSGSWAFELGRKKEDGSTEVIPLEVPESFRYDTKDREANKDIFWIKPEIWAPLGTVIALMNQSGVTFWLNAANNRWGGWHLPHVSHQMGTSIDIGVGLAWKQPSKVPAIRERDDNGNPNQNASQPVCLHGMNRVAMWVTVQSLLLVGVDQILYADLVLLEECLVHLLGAEVDVPRDEPKKRRESTDPKDFWKTYNIQFDRRHNDHLHAEISPRVRVNGEDPYVWASSTPELLDRLLELAAARNNDPAFWQMMAGLDDVPTAKEDFDGLADGEDWKRWWDYKDTALLPVWSASAASETRKYDECD